MPCGQAAAACGRSRAASEVCFARTPCISRLGRVRVRVRVRVRAQVRARARARVRVNPKPNMCVWARLYLCAL